MTLSHVQVFVNGRRRDSETVFRFPFQEDKIFVFETLRSYGGVVFRLAEHLNRMRESAQTVGLRLPKPLSELREEVMGALNSCRKGDFTLRLAVDERDCYLWIFERKRSAQIYEEGVLLKTTVVRRNLVSAEPPQAKSSAFLNNVLAILGPDNDDLCDTLFLDSDGYVTEATIWNLFMVKANRLWTPQSGILNGVTRQFVIKCVEREGLPVVESNLTRHDVWNADEAFLTNTSGEIVPIRSLDGRWIGKQMPGKVTKRLTVRFREELKRENRRVMARRVM